MALINQRKLSRLSREPKFLVQASLFLIFLTLMISGVIAALKPAGEGPASFLHPGDILKKAMGSDLKLDLDAESLASAIRNRTRFHMGLAARDFNEMRFYEAVDAEVPKKGPDYEILKNRVETSTAINEGARERLLLLVEALHRTGEPREKAIENLQSIEEEKRYRNEFLGDAWLAAGEPERAIQAYFLEGKQYENARYSQRSALIAFIERREAEELRATYELPGFRKALNIHERLAAAEVLRDYRMLLIDSFRLIFGRFLSPHALTAFYCAAIWFVILTSMGGFSNRLLLWGLLALFLGVVSDALAIFCISIQEGWLNFVHDPDDPVLDQFIVMVAGIGLREETVKLICYIPLAILTLRYRDPVFSLIIAAIVGLGFAMGENIGYFSGSPNDYTAWNRLLSANALHFSLTGIVGYSFYQLLLNKGRRWENFLIDFLFVVVIHGIYDGMIMIPQLGELGRFNFIILVITCYRYLDLLRANVHIEGIARRISPLGMFVLGSALLACSIMVISTWRTGDLQFSFGVFITSVAASLPMAFAFISRMRDL